MNAVSQLAAIGLISTAATTATWWVRGAPERRILCDPATLLEGEICLSQIPSDAPVLWVDARARKEWEKNGVAGSVLWNLDGAEDVQAFEADVAMRILETPRVIVYCGDENCGVSRQVADQITALKMGAQVSVLRGGWRALRDAGRVKDSSPGI